MNRRILTGAVLAAALLVISYGLLSAQVNYKYLGVKLCARCHKTEASGNQYGRWYYSTHAKAYKRLDSSEAREVAKKVGLSEDPQQTHRCLKCHTTAYDVDSDSLGEGFTMADGVQCEACHGSGVDSSSLCRVRKSKTKSITAGLIIPIKEVCITCHNPESPTFKGFNLEGSLRMIAHPKPKKK